MSTGLTRWHKLPYPPSQKVRGNGAADVERLAVRADAELDATTASWTVVQKPDSALYVLGSTITGVIANQTQSDFFNWTGGTLFGTNPPGSGGPGLKRSTPEAQGWYGTSVAISSVPSGTATVNSRRLLTVKIFDDSGSPNPAEIFGREDYEVGSGETTVQVDFVAFFGLNYRISISFFHANTGSTLNITTTSTYLAFHRIVGVV